jgi:uncharacterized damage-inducible protein DinB
MIKLSKIACLSFLTVLTLSVSAQEIPYAQIPNAPQIYTSGTIMGRLADGLGFRFYWASQGLTEENLNFKAGEETRTIAETIDHIYDLVYIFSNATKEQPTVYPINKAELSFEEKRIAILKNIEMASAILKFSVDKDFERYQMIFQYPQGNGQKLPFWNALNGPLEDALWHVGQVVSLRRTAGNPFDSKVDVLNGVRN